LGNEYRDLIPCFVYLIKKNMAALIIESNNSKNLKLIAELAKQLGSRVKSVSLENMEDFIFGEMINESKTGDLISKEDLLKTLQNNKSKN
jgi:hypothetical protein